MNISNMKIIITEEPFNQLIESEPQTMTFWHGGNLENYNNNPMAQKAGRYEYGPGLYLITKYEEAVKYSKGSRKLYKVTVAMGNEISKSLIPINDAINFVNKYVSPKIRKDLIERFQNKEQNGSIPGYIMNNLIINFDSIKPAYTKYLRQFYIDHNIDYDIIDNAFGWNNAKMMVLFNMNKIVNVERIMPNTKIDKFDLHENIDNKVLLGYHSTKQNLKNGFYKGNVLDVDIYPDVIRTAYMDIISDYDENLENEDIEKMNEVFVENGYGFTYVSKTPIESTNYQYTKYKYGDFLYKVYGNGNETILDDYNELNAEIVVSKNPLYFESVDDQG